MWKRTIRTESLALLLVATVILGVSVSPIQVRAVPAFTVQKGTSQSFNIPNYSTLLTLNDLLFANKITHTATYVNFFTAAYSTTSGATQTFGIAACCSANGVSLAENGIFSDHMEVVATATSGTPNLYLNYTMPSISSYAYPPSIVSGVQVVQSPYLSDAGSFSFCAAPCAYINTANSTLILKVQALASVTVDFWYTLYNPNPPNPNPSPGPIPGPTPAPGGGGGGGGAAFCIPNLTCPSANPCGANQVYILGACQTPVLSPPVTGNPTLIPYGLAAIAGIFVIVFLPGFIGGRGHKNRTFRLGGRSEPRYKPSGSRTSGGIRRSNRKEPRRKDRTQRF